MLSAQSKILIVRFSSIGDIVLTSAAVRCIKEQTGASIHFLTKQSYRTLLEYNPHISKVFSFKKNINEVVGDLQSEKYDYLIDLHYNLRSFLLKRKLNCPSFAFDKLNWQKWLLVNFKINKLPDIHIVNRYIQTLSSLDVFYDGKGLEYYYPTKTAAVFECMNIRPSYLVFAIGGQHATKQLPNHKIIDICQKINKITYIIGGKEDIQNGNIIASSCGKSVRSLCGKLNLHESAILIEKSIGLITHDTGMMHIGAAFKQRLITIWGNTVPDFGMYPFYPKDINYNTNIEVEGLSCRPCSKIGYKECPKGHFKCMENIDVPKIVEVVNSWIRIS